jgi:hypothetical protein
MCVIAGLAIMAVAAQAFIFDGQIKIDRALNSPTLTIRYTNANAALVELRVNGESVATRTVNANRNSGETTFSLSSASLNAGDNSVEIRLFDKSGKLLASETTTVTTETTQGPIYLTNPKMGATIKGNVNIKVGFGRDMKNSYVSFFIDNQFKSISNVPPFEFNWDTTRDTNGWHEVEAWVVDETSATFKTKKIRVFVQNAGGRTDRITQPETADPAKATAPTPPVAAPKPPVGELVVNNIVATVGSPTGTKPAIGTASTSSGPKEMLPTGKRLAKPAGEKIALKPTEKPITPKTATISITKGQKLPPIGSFAIVFNTQFVNFDVQPRVTSEGIPLTPFRHLIEKAGGKVDWENKAKNVTAEADGRNIFIHIGDSFALIDKKKFDLEIASFIEQGRTIVPLSFMRDALDVNIDYDKATGHVLITNAKK